MKQERSEKMFERLFALLAISAASIAEDCRPSITTASGSASPNKICSGNLIFEENFNTLDKTKWIPESTFWGGGVSLLMIIGDI